MAKQKKNKDGDEQKISKKQLLKEQQEFKLKQKLEEEEKEKQDKLEKERLKNLAKKAKEKEKIAILENDIRNDILQKSCAMFDKVKEEKLQRDINQREQENWVHYLKCDGKPNPSDMNAMNYYLYCWNNDDKSDQMENLLTRSDEVFEILDLLEEFIQNPLNESNYTVNLWKEMRQRFLHELSLRVDNATYNAIHNVEKFMQPINKYSAKLVHDKPKFAIGLWAKKETADPCPCPDNTEPLFPVAELPEVNVTVKIPYQLTFQFYVVRVNWLKYDSYSELSRTSKPKLMPDEFFRNLYEFNKDEHEIKERLKREFEDDLRLKKERKKRRRRNQDRLSKSRKGSKIASDSDPNAFQYVQRGSSIFGGSYEGGGSFLGGSECGESRCSYRSSSFNLQEVESGPLKLPSEIINSTEEAGVKFLRRYLEIHMEPNTDELNLRRYMILGGIYHIDFLEALPQPVILPDRSVLRLTYGESVIKFIKFDWKNNHIQRKSLRKLKDYFDELSKCLDLGKLDQRASIRELFMGGEARQSKYIIPGELRPSMMQEKMKEKSKKKGNKQKIKGNEEQLTGGEDGDSEEKSKHKKKSGEGNDLDDEIDLDEESSSEDDEQIADEPLIFNEADDEDIEDDGQDEDAFDEKRRYDEEISILEFDEINFKPEIFIKLSKEVFWFENPILVTWNAEKNYWSTKEGMQNIKFDEEKQEISFRMEAHRTPIALAVHRYINLPFTKWELKPVFNDSNQVEIIAFDLHTTKFSVKFLVMAQKVSIQSIEFKIGKSAVDLNVKSSQLMNTPQSAEKHYGKFYKPDKMIKLLESMGLDIFPDLDAHLYSSGILPKHWICKQHLNMCVALACTTHAFKYSRWNRIVGHKKILLNIRETFYQNFKTNFKLTMITPERATYLIIDEDSREFDDTTQQASPYYPDLYWLIQDNSSTMTKSNMKNIDMALVDTVYLLLSRTHIFSYS